MDIIYIANNIGWLQRFLKTTKGFKDLPNNFQSRYKLNLTGIEKLAFNFLSSFLIFASTSGISFSLAFFAASFTLAITRFDDIIKFIVKEEKRANAIITKLNPFYNFLLSDTLFRIFSIISIFSKVSTSSALQEDRLLSKIPSYIYQLTFLGISITQIAIQAKMLQFASNLRKKIDQTAYLDPSTKRKNVWEFNDSIEQEARKHYKPKVFFKELFRGMKLFLDTIIVACYQLIFDKKLNLFFASNALLAIINQALSPNSPTKIIDKLETTLKNIPHNYKIPDNGKLPTPNSLSFLGYLKRLVLNDGFWGKIAFRWVSKSIKERWVAQNERAKKYKRTRKEYGDLEQLKNQHTPSEISNTTSTLSNTEDPEIASYDIPVQAKDILLFLNANKMLQITNDGIKISNTRINVGTFYINGSFFFENTEITARSTSFRPNKFTSSGKKGLYINAENLCVRPGFIEASVLYLSDSPITDLPEREINITLFRSREWRINSTQLELNPHIATRFASLSPSQSPSSALFRSRTSSINSTTDNAEESRATTSFLPYIRETNFYDDGGSTIDLTPEERKMLEEINATSSESVFLPLSIEETNFYDSDGLATNPTQAMIDEVARDSELTMNFTFSLPKPRKPAQIIEL